MDERMDDWTIEVMKPLNESVKWFVELMNERDRWVNEPMNDINLPTMVALCRTNRSAGSHAPRRPMLLVMISGTSSATEEAEEEDETETEEAFPSKSSSLLSTVLSRRLVCREIRQFRRCRNFVLGSWSGKGLRRPPLDRRQKNERRGKSDLSHQPTDGWMETWEKKTRKETNEETNEWRMTNEN